MTPELAIDIFKEVVTFALMVSAPFLGIMLGIFFHMLNSLFAHIGLLQNWPPLSAAVVPSAAFLTAALLMMWWVERR